MPDDDNSNSSIFDDPAMMHHLITQTLPNAVEVQRRWRLEGAELRRETRKVMFWFFVIVGLFAVFVLP